MTENISACYGAVYYCGNVSEETGVYALLFREKIGEEQRARFVDDPTGESLIIRGNIAVRLWTDSEDRTCLKAIGEYLRNLSID
jgi:hypothetical protein